MNTKKTILATILGTLLTTPAFSWVVERNFEGISSAPRAPLERSDGVQYFQDYANRQVFVTEAAQTGGRALEMRVVPPYVKGKTAFSVWAGGVGFGTGDTGYLPKEGEEVWSRVWVYFSPNWSWAPGKGSMLKIMRIHTSNLYEGEFILQADPGNAGAKYSGYIMASTQNFTGGNIQMYAGTSGDTSGAGAPIPIGRWFSLEGYIKISSNPNIARTRVWLDGNLVLERSGNQYGYLNRQTLNRVGAHKTLGSPGAVLFSTWDIDHAQSGPTLPNGGQFARFDNLVVTNEPGRATATDAKGNRMIGPGTVATRAIVAPAPALEPDVFGFNDQ